MPRSTRWVKARAHAPGLVVSTALTCMVGALLPHAAGGVLFYGGLAAEMLLFAGKGEQLVARVAARSRPMTAAERAALAPALTLLCQRALGPTMTVLRVQPRVGAICAAGLGRRTVLISAGLIAAARNRRLPVDEVAAVIAHAAGPVLAGATRRDPALLFWTLPWRVLRGSVGVAVRAVGAAPLASLAWRTRLIYAPIAVVVNTQDGYPVIGVGSASVIVLSYLIPRWERSWPAHLNELDDHHVREVGLAPALAGSSDAGPARQPRSSGFTSSPNSTPPSTRRDRPWPRYPRRPPSTGRRTDSTWPRARSTFVSTLAFL